jgi:hypothetical protein
MIKKYGKWGRAKLKSWNYEKQYLKLAGYRPKNDVLGGKKGDFSDTMVKGI